MSLSIPFVFYLVPNFLIVRILFDSHLTRPLSNIRKSFIKVLTISRTKPYLKFLKNSPSHFLTFFLTGSSQPLPLSISFQNRKMPRTLFVIQKCLETKKQLSTLVNHFIGTSEKNQWNSNFANLKEKNCLPPLNSTQNSSIMLWWCGIGEFSVDLTLLLVEVVRLKNSNYDILLMASFNWCNLSDTPTSILLKLVWSPLRPFSIFLNPLFV